MLETPIQFWHRNRVQTIAAISAGRSVLNYLRLDCSLTGTKEGCAEGDCGACCVMTVSQGESGLVFNSINACIHPVANLHGKALLSVEDLSAPSRLHPVQTEMVSAHGSQCGFCTPGFVMSLAACTEQARCDQTTVNRASVLEAISGNLCRCTGYKPIIQAGLFAARASSGLDHNALTHSLAQVAISKDWPPSLASKLGQAPTVISPRSMLELSNAMQTYPQAPLAAGWSDVGLWLTKQLREIPVIISTVQIPELQGIHHTAQGLDIGAAATLTDLGPHLLAIYPELHEWFERFASLPIRNAATLGGNIAGGSPIGDSMPVLLALDAHLLLQHGEVQRRLPLSEFYLAYQQKDLQAGEYIRRIVIPTRPKDLRLAVYKVSKRFEDDISAVCAAFAFELDAGVIRQARFGFGGVAATPIRALSVENAMLNQVFSEATLSNCAPLLETAFTPLSDHRASASYRQTICANLMRRAAAQWFSAEPTRVFAGVEGAV